MTKTYPGALAALGWALLVSASLAQAYGVASLEAAYLELVGRRELGHARLGDEAPAAEVAS